MCRRVDPEGSQITHRRAAEYLESIDTRDEALVIDAQIPGNLLAIV
jgi:hypothetical protein